MKSQTEELKAAIEAEKSRYRAYKRREAVIAFSLVLLQDVDGNVVECINEDTYHMPYHGMTLVYDAYYDKVYVKYRAPFLWTKKICTFTAYLRQSRVGAKELLELLESYGKYNQE